MGNTIKLDLPDSVYNNLKKKANTYGQTPEELVTELVEDNFKQKIEDPLLQLAGILESNVSDVSENHDKYIGENIKNDSEDSK